MIFNQIYTFLSEKKELFRVLLVTEEALLSNFNEFL